MTSEFVKGFLDDGCPGPTAAEQAINIIKYIGDRVSLSGQRIKAMPEDLFAIIGAPSLPFADDLVIELRNLGLLDGIESKTLVTAPSLLNVNLTLTGWERYGRRREVKSRETMASLP
jgi:hypothetical protein